MKTKFLLLGLAMCMAYATPWAQTSFGGFIDPNAANNAGTGGGGTNSYFGYQAGLNTTGNRNTAIGYRTLTDNTTGHRNTATGAFALLSNTTGERNTANGHNALYYNTTGNYNTANGDYALYHNTAGNHNTATGIGALEHNTTGNDNTAIGGSALYSNTTGNNNTATGIHAIEGNTTGDNNTANGAHALEDNTIGYRNTANGAYALTFNTTGYRNTANGYAALYSNTTGHRNTATGYYALRQNTTGHRNTANGHNALHDNTTGFRNTATGVSALRDNTTGDYNTAVGYDAGPNAGTRNNTTAIGNGATTTASHQVRIGNANVTSIGGYAGWTTLPSDSRFKINVEENITGLAFINKLRPVSYNVDLAKIRSALNKSDSNNDTPPISERRVGFIAQEVDQVVTENRYIFSGVDIPENEGGQYGIRYAEFVVPLVKAVQELSTENEEQKQLVEKLQQLMETQQQRIEALESLITTTAKGNPDGSIQAKNMDIADKGFELHQNIPNPFHQTTTISASVPQGVNNAKIVIYNMQGAKLETYPVNQRGNVSVHISGEHLPPGIYLYTLVADDKIIETKKMILTR